MKGPKLFLDFETEAIGLRPNDYPPKPVGYAYKIGSKHGYCSWGHPGKNSHKFDGARSLLDKLVGSAVGGVVCHNTPFDREVSQVHMQVEREGLWDDTMILAFLNDPHGPLSLKPLATKHLGMPPEEQDAVRAWLEANGIVRPKQKDWGAYIAKAPASVVGPYALGDVLRTERLYEEFKQLHGSEAYIRELKLSPIITDMERQGVLIDVLRLQKDTDTGFKTLDLLDGIIKKGLGDIDLDKDADVADALEKRKLLNAPLPLTDGGKPSTNKKALIACMSNKLLLGHMLMRGALATCLRTFMHPWLLMATQNKGRIFFRFNQIRGEGGLGARTGRMSSSPNMMNVPDKWEQLMGTLAHIKYKPLFVMPNIRSYILPDPGCVIASLDYSQQEMRLFAHYEDGELMEAYKKNPRIDAHDMVAKLSGLPRKAAKTLNFAELYGAGAGVVMQWLDCDNAEAREFKRIYNKALPGVAELKRSIEAELKSGKGITTIGGRSYMPEPPKYINGQLRSFNYKMLNYLIQGSAADQTKQAIIDYSYNDMRKGRVMFPVHDQLVVSVPKDRVKTELELLNACMVNSLAESLDVPFLTDTKVGNDFSF